MTHNEFSFSCLHRLKRINYYNNVLCWKGSNCHIQHSIFQTGIESVHVGSCWARRRQAEEAEAAATSRRAALFKVPLSIFTGGCKSLHSSCQRPPNSWLSALISPEVWIIFQSSSWLKWRGTINLLCGRHYVENQRFLFPVKDRQWKLFSFI